MHGGNRCGAGQDHAERFGDAGHGGCRAHHRAGAGGGGEPALDRRHLLGVDVAGAIARPKTAAIGAGAEPLAAMIAGHHRPRDQHDGGTAGGHRTHQLRRHRLVAAAHQHGGVHRLRANHLLGVHRHQVAILEAGRAQKNLAERNRGKLDRQCAGGEHAAFDRLEQVGKMPMAIVEPRLRVGDADHGPRQHLARIAHRLRERAPQIEREIAVAVVG